jgi:hypothetical protein
VLGIQVKAHVHGGLVMINSRHLERNGKRKLIDNLEQVSLDLIAYVTDLQRVRELIAHFTKAGKQYNDPLDSWLWYWIYIMYRSRKPDIHALVATLNQSGSSETLLAAIEQFFSSGGWESTSVNTNLMYELLSRLPGYDDTNPRASLSLPNIVRLKELFLEQTAATLRPDVAIKVNNLQVRRHQELQNELQGLTKKRNIKHDANELLENFPSSAAKPVTAQKPQRGPKLDAAKFGGVQADLEVLLQNRLARLPDAAKQETVKMPNEVKKLDPTKISAVAEKLTDMLSAKARQIKQTDSNKSYAPYDPNAADIQNDFMPPSTPPLPPLPPTLSPAAFEARDNNKYEKVVYHAPVPKPLAVSAKQLQALNRLFGASAKKEKPQEVAPIPSSPLCP